MASEDINLDEAFTEEKAATYCTDAGVLVPGYDAVFEMSTALLAKRVPEDGKVLVLGAGGGSELVAFGRAFQRWRLTAVDPSEAMLSVAERRVDEQGIADRVETVCGKIEDISAERRFDAATCVLVMHFIKDDGSKLELLQEIGKRLTPGAPLIMVNVCGIPGTEEHSQKFTAVKIHARRKGKSEEFLERYERGIMQIPSVSEARDLELLQEAGFRVGFEFFRALFVCGWIAYKEGN